MWRLVNRTPYAARHAFLRGRDGAEVLVVAVKATFSLGRKLEIAKTQLPVLDAPVYFGEPRNSSLRFECDFALEKQSTDVLVHGHAYARGGPSVAVDTSLRVGTVIDKTVRAVGDRVWERSLGTLAPSTPVPFERMSLRYERAFGGDGDDRNPVGVGWFSTAEQARGAQLPNLEDPRSPGTSWKHRPTVSGYGPIARDWLPRRARAGTHDDRWLAERHPLVPADFDARFHQCAPDDQQVLGHLHGGETFELRNVTRSGLLSFALPHVRIGVTTRMSGSLHRLAISLHTVVVEPDERRLVMVWGASLPCHHEIHTIERSTIFTEPEAS
jgi:hypothetical protein